MIQEQENLNLNLGCKLIPEIDKVDFFSLLNQLDYDKVAARILHEIDVTADDKNYYQDLYKKLKHFISKEQERFYKSREQSFFTDRPMFNIKDLNQYVILLNTPFVEKSKQEKFKQYLTTKSVLTEFSSLVKDIFFPYEDSEKAALEKGAICIIKFSSIEEARLVRQTIDGKFIMKNNQGTALLFDEFIQLINNDSEITDLKSMFSKSHEWESKALEEQFIKRNDSGIQLYNFHYFKKKVNPLASEINIHNTYPLSFSPNGTYLIQNNSNSIIFYSGNEELKKVIELPENCQEFIVSSNEKHLVSFLGLGNTNLISDVDYIRDIISRQNVFIWDILGKEIVKSIKITNDEDFSNFKFSSDSQFLARLKNDTLIIYEAPEFKMLIDSSLNKRHPLTDKVNDYYWFPNRNYIMTVREVKKNKNIDTTLDFYEIPSRRKCNLSIPFTHIKIVSYKWHPNNKTLLLLLKAGNTPEWTIRIIEFNFNNFTHKSKNIEVIKPVVRVNKEAPITEKDLDYASVEVFWMDNGSEIMVAAKKRLLIPMYVPTEKKYIINDNGYSMNMIMFKFNEKDMKTVPWSNKDNAMNLRYDSIIVSPNSKSFILTNSRIEDRSSYGESLVMTIDGGEIHEINKINFGDKFSKIKLDQSGRFFAVELNRVSIETFDKSTGGYKYDGTKIYNINGELLLDIKDSSLKEVSNNIDLIY